MTRLNQEKDRVYVAMDKFAKELWVSPLVESFDPGVNQSVDERVLVIYNGLYDHWNQFEEKLREWAYDDLLVAVYGGYNPPDHVRKGWRDTCKKIEFSISQRLKNPAVNSIEDTVDYFLDLAKISYEREKDRIDIIAQGKCDVSISCKHSLRDRVNDKDDAVQILYIGEISRKIYKHFAEKGMIVIIIEPEERKKGIAIVEKLGIKLPIYSFSEGLKEIEKKITGEL